MNLNIKMIMFLIIIFAGFLLIQADFSFACCDSHYTKKCYNDDLYWYDSCNVKEGLFQDCGDDSYNDSYQCSGNWVQREKVDRGCTCNACFANTIWENYQDCAALGKTCQSGACVTSCSDECGSGARQCSGTTGYQTCGDYNSDGCLEWSGVTNCDSGYSCSEGSCVSGCLPHSTKSCYSNDLYWYDSCNNQEELFQDCGENSYSDNYQCSGDWVQREKIERGCSVNDCYANTIWENYQDCVSIGKTCQGGACVTSCTDECSSGARQCSGTTGYQTCGNYNSDSCLEWSSVSDCPPNQTCSEGTCTGLPLPAADIKLDNSDGPISLACDASGILSWTSVNADSCLASGDWSGAKSVSGSESTGILNSSKTYTITCSGSGTSASDSVTVTVICGGGGYHALGANAGADKETCSSGSVLLDGSASDSLGDSLTYSWSCTDGSLQNATSAQTTYNAPAVSQETNFTCTLTANCDRGSSASDQTNIKVKVCGNSVSAGGTTVALTIDKLVRNLSGSTAFSDSVSAKPGDVVSFSIKITAQNAAIQNIILKDSLPDRIAIRKDTLKIDGTTLSGDISTGINIGNFSAGQSKTITFDADISPADKFDFGENQLVNSATAYNSELSGTDSAKIIVSKTAILGATSVSTGTGLTNIILASLIALSVALVMILFLDIKFHLFGSEQWIEGKILGYKRYRSDNVLRFKTAQVKLRETIGEKIQNILI